MSSERSIAQQTQEKFQFYFLALAFTLLGAAVQTSNFNRSTTENVFELIGWLGFLSAGLFGLWKMEWESPIRVQMAKRDEIQSAITDLKTKMLGGLTEVLIVTTGRMQPVDERMKNHDDAVAILSAQLDKLEKWDTFKYLTAKYGFLVGLVALMGSRSAAALATMFGYKLH
jgi:hypothetical protein